MLVSRPDYYDRFQCIAGECPATCCAGWEIGIDKKSLDQYKSMKGTFGNRLHNSIDARREVFLQYERRCMFLNEDQLCDIYMEVGPDFLCHTCKTYPRHIECYEGTREFSLIISCPEVARIILSNPNKLQIITTIRKDDTADETGMKALDEFDFEFFELLKEARNVSIQFLQMRDISVQIRMAIVLALAHDLQRRIRNNEIQDMKKVLDKYQNPEVIQTLIHKIRRYQGRSKERYLIIKKLMRTASKLKVLNIEWSKKVSATKRMLKNLSPNEYERLYRNFSKQRNQVYCNAVDWELILEQLMCYFTYSYFCTAAYDFELYAKMKFAVVSTLLIQEVSFCQWLNQEKTLTFDDVLCNTYQFAREVEHLNENLDALDRILTKKNYYKLEELLICILSPDIL